MLGARVLFSSATLAPVLVCALFEAYRNGRKHFNELNSEGTTSPHVICAWFDEFSVAKAECANKAELMKQHTTFVDKRVKNLTTQPVLRKASLLEISTSSRNPSLIINQLAEMIQQGVFRLHSQHNQRAPNGHNVSIGLVRMANINPMVAVAKQLLRMAVPADCSIHYCVYHSQYPLAVRSAMEEKLDAALTRHDISALWQQAEIKKILDEPLVSNHIFVVLATSVAEVGRDHDYDWAIAEPSSVRSLIQLAGRIQRHRQQPPLSDNLLILSQNYKALKASVDRYGKLKPAYSHPGFERDDLRLDSHDLKKIFPAEHFQEISALPRITQPKLMQSKIHADFLTLEHFSLLQILFPKSVSFTADNQGWPTDYAARWWQHEASWCAELQKRKPFRKSLPDELYCLVLGEEDEEPVFTQINEVVWPPEYIEAGNFTTESWEPTQGNHTWFALDILTVYRQLAEQQALTVDEVSKQFGEIRLRVMRDAEKWHYNPFLGIFQDL